MSISRNRIIAVDIMIGERFYAQYKYQYCPILKIDINDIANKVAERYPSLKNKKNVTLCLNTQTL